MLPYIGEIRYFAYVMPPQGWSTCEGQILTITAHRPLFDVIGNRFGGDGKSTFALPNLRGRVGVHAGNGGGATYRVGDKGGAATVTISNSTMPAHRHSVNASPGVADRTSPEGAFPGSGKDDPDPALAIHPFAAEGSEMVALAAATVREVGGGTEHANIQPTLTLNACIFLGGSDGATATKPAYLFSLGEIRLYAGANGPLGFSLCEGQMLSVDDAPELYQLIYDIYGSGPGTFALPDLRGRGALGQELVSPAAHTIGEKEGAETVALTGADIPYHLHSFLAASGPADRAPADGSVFANSTSKCYAPQSAAGGLLFMASGVMDSAGKNQAHANMMPSTAVNFLVCSFGVPPAASATVPVESPDNLLGEIRAFAFDAVPDLWLPCDGQLVPIGDYPLLFGLIGTSFGGDGMTTFGVPDLRGRTPIGAGTGPGLTERALGELLGSETVALTADHLPAHRHDIFSKVATSGQVSAPADNFLANCGVASLPVYAAGSGTELSDTTIGSTGGGNAHQNRQSYLVLNYGIATAGLQQ